MGRKLAYSVYLRDPDGTAVCIEAGTEAPAWTKGKIGDHAFEPDSADEVVDYNHLTVNKLEAEIKDRNEDRDEDDKIVPDGDKKADLIAALEVDDAAHAG